MKNKKKIFGIIGGIFLLGLGIFSWQKWASTTRIALVNFQSFQASNIILSNKDNFIQYEEVALEDLDKLSRYDFVLGWGMGLRISEEQREILYKTAEKVPTHFIMPTAPENDINSIPDAFAEKVSDYINGGTRENYQNLARYIRKNIDGKKLFVDNPADPKEAQNNVYFHLDENVAFEKLTEFETYLKKNDFYKENAPKVVLFSGIHSPFGGNKAHLDSTIASLQKSGLNVYPITSFEKRLEFLQEVNPDAVVYFPHGRMRMMGGSDEVVDWLKERNIPLFTPLSVLQLDEDWQNDPMGMFGGFMGQSVVMPELDGAIYPYTIIAQEKTKEGLFVFKTLPNRLKNFTQIVNNFIALKQKKNEDKKVAIFYLKGAGSQALVGQGMEVAPSLYNVLKRMKSEGYKVDNLPATLDEFKELLHKSGSVFAADAKGTFDAFIKNGNPALIEEATYENWLKNALTEKSYKEITERYGNGVGDYMTTEKNGNNYLSVARIQFGNVVIMPQPVVALGKDDFTAVHGVQEPPTHAYMGAYLWTQNEFKADALVHFGTHGSLEFTPQKQVALSDNDWSDVAVGTMPHFYYYTIANVGEGMIAKRRSYATTISYLTPAFTESDMRNHFRELMENIRGYFNAPDYQKNQASLLVKKVAVKMGLHLDLRLDGDLSKPYSEEDIEKLENFAEEVSTEKINGQLYTMGVPYSSDKLHSTVMAMSADPLAYSLATLDKHRGKITDKELKNKSFFTQNYLNPAKNLVNSILSGQKVDNQFIANIAKVSVEEIEKSRDIIYPPAEMPYFVKKSMEKKMNGDELSDVEKQLKEGKIPKGMPEFVAKRLMERVKRGERLGNHPGAKKEVKREKSEEKAVIPKDVREKALAILEIERALMNIVEYRNNLHISPELELKSFLNALSGGYVAPSAGGDPIANAKSIPTGRNLYAINAEITPTLTAWDRGVSLAQKTIEEYQKNHNGEYPKKVAYTFWSSEFIETEGVTIAQVMYMLGVEPVRDSYGRINDVRLIPAKELGRPRIDVVIQTSGQFRDLAASRLFLLTKAIELASSAKDEGYENLVNKGSLDIEKELVAKGISPKDARELSKQRIFGGINGNYDTATKGMILSGDKWETNKEIADTYINNMGAVYGKEKEWGNHQAELFRAALQNTDVIIQPRQNNTWGALSLDHVFEFMGGMNSAIKEVTGKDPDAYLADYRNHNNMKMQELKEAIGVEARSTIFNPKYIKEMIQGGETSANNIMDIVTNIFGWEATRPEAIDDELWDKLYETYIEDKDNLGVKDFFRKQNPASLQEITAIMLEATRKGMWKASEDKIQNLVKEHTDLVKEFGAEPSGFAGENKKLQEYVANKAGENAKEYQEQIKKMQESSENQTDEKDGKVLKKEEISNQQSEKINLNGLWIGGIAVAVLVAMGLFLKKRRNSEN